MSGRRNWLVVADLDGPARKYHVGDEAMFEANLMRLRRQLGPDLQVAAFSSDPEFTRQRYALAESWLPPRFRGGRRGAVEPLGFGLRLAVTPRRGAPGARGWIRKADALLISGGGNLNSIYRMCLKQRLAIALAARCRRIPVLMVGQGLGPIRGATDRWHLRILLGLCSAVGIRDRAMSPDCLRSLGDPGPPPRVHIDDAFDLPPAQDDATTSTGPAPERRWLALSLHHPQAGTDTGAAAARWITLLERILGRFPDLALCFLPHIAGESPLADDLALARSAASRLSGVDRDRVFLPTAWTPARTVRAWTARCAAVMTTRYHQAVFAAACGLPWIGLAASPYAGQKLAGLRQLLGGGPPILPMEAEPEEILRTLEASLTAGTVSRTVQGPPAPPQLPAELLHPLGPCAEA